MADRQDHGFPLKVWSAGLGYQGNVSRDIGCLAEPFMTYTLLRRTLAGLLLPLCKKHESNLRYALAVSIKCHLANDEGVDLHPCHINGGERYLILSYDINTCVHDGQHTMEYLLLFHPCWLSTARNTPVLVWAVHTVV